ncbi:MAG TPA: acyl-CoA desaturase [Tepidisphaeraceae bacterium]
MNANKAPLEQPEPSVISQDENHKPAGPMKFNGSDRFIRELRKRVDAYFEQTGCPRRDCPKMYFKTASILAWFIGAYILLLFFIHTWWLIVPLAMILGLSMAAIGFNIQHDGSHKGYSNRQWVNKTMAMTLDLMGGSSYMWNWKHNSIHHTYPNVDGQDDDINIGCLGRLSPQQPRYRFHRFQGIYLWLLYGFLAIKWHLFDDFCHLAMGRIGNHTIPRPKGFDLLTFIGGKVLFFSMAFVIPMLLHPWWAVLATYAVAAFTCGVVLSVVFQLAHCLGEAEFPVAVVSADGQSRLQTEWAVHQVQTTVNFARNNRLIGWYVGGLNFQIEHHLFHKICHIHYPALSKVVEEACQEFGIRYQSHPTFFSAVASHYQWLKLMGKPQLQ